jgi:hypothetical protein
MINASFIQARLRPAVVRGLFGFLWLSLLAAGLDAQSSLIERTPVQSSDLASVGYDASRRMLEIEFRSGGIYRYLEVPAEIHERLLAAESKGRFFAAHIRDRFRHERVRARASAAK